MPCSFPLNPLNETEMCGRSNIYLHGCGVCTPGDFTSPPNYGCSLGCIIMRYTDRIKVRTGDYIHVHLYEYNSSASTYSETYEAV